MTDARTQAILDLHPLAACIAAEHTTAGIPALEAADLAGTATLALVRVVDDFDGRGELRGYAGRRIRWALVDELRRMRAGKKLHHNDVRILSLHALAGRPARARADDARLDVDAALAKLPANEKMVIVRYYLQGQRLKDVAAEIGRSPSRVSQIKKRALANLEKLLG